MIQSKLQSLILGIAVLHLLFITPVFAQKQTELSPCPPNERKVGIAYSLWHDKLPWRPTWGTPKLGQYLSNDPNIIRQHAEWLTHANVDFIYIDWSNDINTGVPGTKPQATQMFIEQSTQALFEEYSKLPNHPKVAIMIGFPDNKEAISDGRLTRKADQVWQQFAHNPQLQNVYEHYRGHPLLIVYTGTPTPFPNGLPQ